jgi:ribonuclease HI
VVNPKTNSITHINIKSQAERHTINRVELAAIAVALKQENTTDHMSILTDDSFCINAERNYTIDPAAYNQHLHRDLPQLTNQLLQEIDFKQLKTHIGKVKSRTHMWNTTKHQTNWQEHWCTEEPRRILHLRMRTHQSGASAHARKYDTLPQTNQKTLKKTCKPQSKHKKGT